MNLELLYRGDESKILKYPSIALHMEPDLQDMVILIGLIFILQVVFIYKSVKFLIEPLTG